MTEKEKVFVIYWGFRPILGNRAVRVCGKGWFTPKRGYSSNSIEEVSRLGVDEIIELIRNPAPDVFVQHRIWRVE